MRMREVHPRKGPAMSHPISRRNFVSSSLSATAAANSVRADAATQAPTEANTPPNILWIMTDQQRYDCVGANGNSLIQTPNLISGNAL